MYGFGWAIMPITAVQKVNIKIRYLTWPGFSEIFSYMPFMPSPGNHDYITVWQESTTLGIPYLPLPFHQHDGPYFRAVDVPEFAEAGGVPTTHEVFYSFDYGNVHFLSLNF